MIKKILFGFLFFILFLAISGYAYYRLVIYTPPLISEEDRAAITLMPLPAKLELNNGFIDISNGLNIVYPQVKNDKITKAVDRLISRIEKIAKKPASNENGITFSINCQEDFLNTVQQAKEDESYTLIIENSLIKLEGNTPYGIIRGLETVFQLLRQEEGELVFPEVEIMDSPRFPWRGIMMDVCRHWIPKDVVLRTIDAMSAVKMNVFHWHLSEDQGFRVESKVYPKLHEIGSNGKYYTQDEIREVVAYAADRGIRVVPEFDLPGHSKSWQMAYPELSTVDFTLEFGTKKGIAFAPPMDPTKEEVYEFLDLFIEEMAMLFPDPYFHIGGDEVNPKYWNESPSIQQFMSDNEMKDSHDLQAYFNKRMNTLLHKHGKLMLGWDEILHPDLGNDIIVQSWRSHKSLFESVQHGGTAILSAGLYLDHILSAEKHYKVDPLILEGAIDIIPDTANWHMYDLTLDIAGSEMKSQLVIFDKNPADVTGFFAMMENRMAFKNGVIEEYILTASFLGPAGEMDVEVEFIGDSLNGKLSLGLLSFDNWGSKSGGSDMAGTEMPKIEIMKPLTEEEKTHIIGGEACQWAEFVDDENVESRLWPRSAAIAEKLWSPQTLTEDVDDMYRRLEVISNQLTIQGSMHIKQYQTKLQDLGGTEGYFVLKTLVDVLEEVKYHGRMPSLMESENMYLPDFPLDRIVDAARPESTEARAFNKQVEEYIMSPTDSALKDSIITSLHSWDQNHEKLLPFIEESEKLQDIEKISLELSEVSNAIIQKVSGDETDFTKEDLMEKLSFLETGEHGVVVAVVPGLRGLLLN